MSNPTNNRLNSTRFGIVVIGAVVTVCCGCSSLMQAPGSAFATRLNALAGKTETQEPESSPAETDDFETNLETPLLGEYISVQGNTVVPLRGVGLVMNLNGTGGDPPPSYLQKKLLAEMARRDIKSPSAILARKDTALVVVTAYLPANVRKGQRFDVRVRLPPNSDATSLQGGYLLMTRLFEEKEIRGAGIKTGHEYATARGPIMTAFGVTGSKGQTQGVLSGGSIPGGAISKDERPLKIVIRKRYQSFRKSKQIAEVIAERFHDFDRFNRRVVLATAKTPALIELESHPSYRNNFPRYQQVIRNLPLAENEVAQRLRIEQLADELLVPETSEKAAVRLEALGKDAKPFLRAGLESPWSDVRFFSAEALAYLDDSGGVEALSQAAEHEPGFRVYAYAALANIKSSQAQMELRRLLTVKSLEARYGAVRALSELDDNDRALNTVRYDDHFQLRQIDDPGQPAVHLTRRRVPEITIFGRDQQLQLPAILNGGHRIRVMGRAGDETVEVTRYSVGKEPVRRECSRNLAEIIRVTGELGAYYSDVVQLMVEAERQHNLAGPLGIDQLPQAGRTYTSVSDDDPQRTTKRKVGTPSRTPGIFERNDEDADSDGTEPVMAKTPGTPDSAEKKPESDDGKRTMTAASADSASDESPAIRLASVDSLSPDGELQESSASSPGPTADKSAETSLLQRFLRNPFAQHDF